MIYTVKSKVKIQELCLALLEQKLCVVGVDTNTLEVHISDDREKELFFHYLSFFIAYVSYEERLRQELLKKNINKNEVEKIVKTEVSCLKDSDYYSLTTNVLVRKYFNQMSTINIDSFRLFNMKGFKEEVDIVIEDIMNYREMEDMEDDEFGEDIMGGMDMDEETGEDLYGNPFQLLRMKAISNNINLKSFAILQLFGEGDKIRIENSNNEVIDDEYFIRNMESILSFEMASDDISNYIETLQDILRLKTIIYVFKVKKLVIHKSISLNAKDLLIYNLNLMKANNEANIEIEFCDGCGDCD